jgi:hypothetical protein
VPRTIVITGASGGFGKLCVERFAAGAGTSSRPSARTPTRQHTSVRPERPDHEKKDHEGTSAVLAAAGLGILLQSPAWAASGAQPASGTFLITSSTVDSARVADGNTILVIALTGNATGTFDGRFTETDHEVMHPDGSVTLLGTGTQFGTLGRCGTGSVRCVTEQQGTLSALSGRFIDQAATTSTPDQDPLGRQVDSQHC